MLRWFPAAVVEGGAAAAVGVGGVTKTGLGWRLSSEKNKARKHRKALQLRSPEFLTPLFLFT
ncbi:Fe2OG dioxygenase domain-containing protein [Psidium guajava]|nr:Fe2OG dioxygenase domain-containing protein [Psidium guajava]